MTSNCVICGKPGATIETDWGFVHEGDCWDEFEAEHTGRDKIYGRR